MAVETRPSLGHIDFSIDLKIIKEAEDLLGSKEVTQEQAKAWINSPAKKAWERVFVGFLGSVLSSPTSLVALGGVWVVAGSPASYRQPAGFLGKGNDFINVVYHNKVRTLKNGIDIQEKLNPLHSTAFYNGRKNQKQGRDPRAHSIFGDILRKTNIDEFPQFWQIATGEMMAVAPRGYSLPELRGLVVIFQEHDQHRNIFPAGFPDDYKNVVSTVRPRPGFTGLYAIHKKDLTISERLFLDHMYLTRANPLADLRILMATAKYVFKGEGKR